MQQFAAPFRLRFGAAIFDFFLHAVLAATALVAAGGALLAVRRARSLPTADQVAGLRVEGAKLATDVGHALDEFRREYKALAEEVEDLIDRARRERARADGRRGGRPPAAPDDPAAQPAPPMTREQYIAHLERTGQRIPQYDALYG